MLIQVAGYERSKYPRYFNEMFHHRKLIFKDHKNWDVTITDDKYEIDEFDREDTYYLMSVTTDGQLIGSVRLIRTTEHHMLDGPFKSMFPDDRFKSANIWEATRFAVVDRCLLPNRLSLAACDLVLGTIQFGLEAGARHIVGVFEAGMSRIYRRCGLTDFERGRHRSQHGTVFLGLCAVSEQHEAAIVASTGQGKVGATPQPSSALDKFEFARAGELAVMPVRKPRSNEAAEPELNPIAA